MDEWKTRGALADRRRMGDLKDNAIQSADESRRLSAEPTFHLKDLHSFPTLILSDKPELARSLQTLDILRVDLVSMPVPLPDGVLSPIQPSDLELLRSLVKDRRTKTETHSSAEMGF